MPDRWQIEPGDPAWLILENRAATRVEDWASVPGPFAEAVRNDFGVSSSVGCPIVVEGRLWGALAVHSKQSRPLPPDTESRIAQFTDLVGTAIANAESRGRADRLGREQAALRRVATLVARGTGPEAVFRAVADEVGALMGCDTAAIVRFEADGWATVMGAHHARRAPGARFEPEAGYVVASVLSTGQAARFDTDDPAAAGNARGRAGRGNPLGDRGSDRRRRRAVGHDHGRLAAAGRFRPARSGGWPTSPSWSRPRSPTRGARGGRAGSRTSRRAAARGDAGRAGRAAGRAVRCGDATRSRRSSGRTYPSWSSFEADGTVTAHGNRRRPAPGGRAPRAGSGLRRRRGPPDRAGRTIRHGRPGGPGHARARPGGAGPSPRSRARSSSRASSGARSRRLARAPPPAPAWSAGSPSSPSWWRPRSPTPRRARRCERLADEQAALRRVATLVAEGASPARCWTRWPRRWSERSAPTRRCCSATSRTTR